MPRPRLRQPWKLGYGLTLLVLAAYGLSKDKDMVLVVAFAIGGLGHVAAGLFYDRPVIVPGPDGPGTLRATPAKRFRATGWPPSKDPDAYR